MTEDEYRAEMARQARIANLIALRRLASDNYAVSRAVDSRALEAEIIQLVFVS